VILGLFTELATIGGMQRAGRHVAAVLTEYASGRETQCQFLSLNDSHKLHHLSVEGREFECTGCAGNKLGFVAPALRTAWRNTELIVAGYPDLGPLGPVAKALAPNTKTVVIAHGVEVWKPLPLFKRLALRRADLVLAPTRNTANHVAVQQGVAEERIRVLPWALDPDFEALIPPMSEPALPQGFPGGRVILTVGRWSGNRYKGVDTLIAALARLLPHQPELQLVVAGVGGDQPWLEQIADECGVRRHVHFLRGLSYAEIAACYSACEIFAMPSRGEGFGLVYLEAMACGKPVIGGSHGGAPEVIEEGKTGFLVRHGDVDRLATSLQTLLDDQALGRLMGARGRERVEREFHFETFARSLKHILGELCDPYTSRRSLPPPHPPKSAVSCAQKEEVSGPLRQ
jgi:glycosyltransferase involved in cell wall biosynthesis